MKIEIELDEYINRVNEAYKQGYKDGMAAKPLSWTYPDPIGNPIINPGVTWKDSDGKLVSDDMLYEKAPYWMNPNFKMPE